MENQENLIEPLFEKATQFGKTSLELIKLKAVDKTAGIMGILVSRSLLWLVLSFFIALINIAASLWLGNILGQVYYGFLAVAAFYGIMGVVLWLLQPLIKIRISNAVIKKILN